MKIKNLRIPAMVSLLLLFAFWSCENPESIEGLWHVESVQVGEESMTPNARWTRLNSDNTQVSGNGRFQHSYGTWKLDPQSNKLTIENLNGLEDLNEPFTVSLAENEMYWERNEEGQDIKVILKRANELPETYGDRILGLWQLEKATGDGYYFESSDQEEIKDYLFLRWDKRFLIETSKGKIRGVYNVHGHKPEVELIPYSDQMRRDFWRIEYGENQITLTLLNSEEEIVRVFKRIHKFPQF